MSAPAAVVKRPRRAIDGVVLVDKPHGITSNAALQRVKRAFNAEKAGHTGTLDPLATGLLPVCLGEATKFSAGLLDADKGYRATIELGVTTDTGDREGAVIGRGEAPGDLSSILRVLDAFRGDILQCPHRYSAIKRDGRALYSYAREGIEVEIAPRAVRILRLEVVRWEAPMLSIDVLCSKGTYIRSLAEDIGVKLGCGGHVADLRRTQVGHLTLDRAVTLDRIEDTEESARDAWLLPLTLLVDRLPGIELDALQTAAFLHGQRIVLPVDALGRSDAPLGDDTTVAVRTISDCAGHPFLGLATVMRDGERLIVAPSRVIAMRARSQQDPDRGA